MIATGRGVISFRQQNPAYTSLFPNHSSLIKGGGVEEDLNLSSSSPPRMFWISDRSKTPRKRSNNENAESGFKKGYKDSIFLKKVKTTEN